MQADGYEWCYRPGSSAGLIPTGGGRTCVFVGVPPARFTADVRRDLAGNVARMLAATSPSVAARVAQGERVGPVRGFAGMRGWLRRPWGPGWALVGDAGYFKDPTTAHGITDALRDAALLAFALDQVLTGTASPSVALAHYERVRDELSLPLFEMTDAIASFDWTLDEVQGHHLRMSEVMQREVELLDAVGTQPGAPLVA